MTIRRRASRAFDLGTGCGIQSILASRHSEKVLAADINPRAVGFAEFNACLNRTENISFSAGSLFEPVTAEKFDLIVCNPPFVIGPKLLYTHTSTGAHSDHFCESIVRNTPKHLAENGYAQIICNWAQVGDETSEEHVGHWLEGSGCDVWVLHSHAEPAEGYARSRADENASDTVVADSLYDEWMAYFGRENITAVNFGLITITAPPRPQTGSVTTRFRERTASAGNRSNLDFFTRFSGHAPRKRAAARHTSAVSSRSQVPKRRGQWHLFRKDPRPPGTRPDFRCVARSGGRRFHRKLQG